MRGRGCPGAVLGVALALASGLAAVPASAGGGGGSGGGGSGGGSIVHGGWALAPWADAATSGRADVVMLGDSNQLFAGHGWDGGWIRAAAATTGVYASGVHWCGENAGVGRGFGDGISTISSGGLSSGFAFTGAPPQLDAFARLYDPAAGSDYLYLASGTLPGTRQVGMRVAGTVSTRAALRYWVVDGVFPASTPGLGLYYPTARIGQPPWSTLALFGVATTRTGDEFALRTTSYTLGADPSRVAPVEFRFSPTFYSEGFGGPFFALWHRVEQVDAPGMSAHTLYAVGGRSARFMAATMAAASDEMLGSYFAEVRRLLPEPRRILVRIHQGLNDRNEINPSVGQGITPGDSPAAFVDNLRVTIDRIRGVWQARGWPQDEVHFLIVTPFMVATEQDVELVGYQEAARALVDEYDRLAVLDQSALAPYAEMVGGNFFATPTDRNHLSTHGYDTLSARELAAVLAAAAEAPPSCPADFDLDGGVTGADVEAFFLAFEAGDGRGDVDGDGGVTGADVEAFFLAFEAGGC